MASASFVSQEQEQHKEVPFFDVLLLLAALSAIALLAGIVAGAEKLYFRVRSYLKEDVFQ